MFTLPSRQQYGIVAVLVLMMLLTRSHHWASVHSLPDASWAIFFLLGVYVRALWLVPVLIAASVLIDYVAITWGGVSDFCVSPAYWLLIPAYAVLFAGGRFYARGHSLSVMGLLRLIGVALVVVAVAQLLTTGGFYFFSGRFAEPTLAGLILRLEKYFPPMLGTFAMYLGVAVVLHLAVVAAFFRRDDGPRTLMGSRREP